MCLTFNLVIDRGSGVNTSLHDRLRARNEEPSQRRFLTERCASLDAAVPPHAIAIHGLRVTTASQVTVLRGGSEQDHRPSIDSCAASSASASVAHHHRPRRRARASRVSNVLWIHRESRKT
jgi:hypothetical protein